MTVSSEIAIRALELFDRVIELGELERSAFLDRHCNDGAVRARIEAMLLADGQDSGLLDKGAVAEYAARAVDGIAAPTMPEKVGSYRIVGRLGEGGMATVYLAKRDDQAFDRTVALKLVHPARQTEHWQSKFLQERQILASLHHANIAVLLDGGITDDGQPYFAMEYVDGRPVTDYCNSERLTLRRRIRLFLSVCDAVSYAHTNLVVHRDLKPSNILVDAGGQPKLLDFGIARILSERNTSQTRTSLRALTPDYAAPEQFTGAPVTTAVDVFALGGLLYELLAGRRPFVSETGSALDIERQIHDRGAPTFAQLEQGLGEGRFREIARARCLTRRKLRRSLRGDLENIVLKALRTEPERRYVSVEALAADLRRYLNGLPVEAQADTAWYRLRKFVARHPVGIPLGSAAVVALVVASAIALQQAREARTAAALARLEAAKATQTRDFVASLFEFAGPDKSLGERLTARQLLDLGAARVDQELAGQPELHAEMLLLLATTYSQIAQYEAALPLAERATALYAGSGNESLQVAALRELARIRRHQGRFVEAGAYLDSAEPALLRAGEAAVSALLVERGELHREQARFDEARAVFERALAIDRARLAPTADIARDLYRLGTLEFSAGNSELGLSLLRDAAERLAAADSAETTLHASIRHDIGVMLIQRGELNAAKEILEAVRATRGKLLGDRHPDLAVTMKELAGIARQQGASDEAESLYLAALDINESMLGPEHPETANNLNSLAVFYRGLGRDEQALEYGMRALDGARLAYGERHPTVGLMSVNVGAMYRMLGEDLPAERSTLEGLDIIVSSVGPDHQLAGVAQNALAGLYHEQGRLDEAEKNYRAALTVFEATAGPSHPQTARIINGLATLLFETGRPAEAEGHFRRAAGIATAELPGDHPTTAAIHMGLARALAASGQCEEALALEARYLPVLEASSQLSRRTADNALERLAACR